MVINSKYRTAHNFIAFYLAWPFCVIPAAKGSPLLGPLLCIPLVMSHFYLIDSKREKWIELRLMLLATAIGFVLDSLLWKMKLVIYQPSPWPEPFAPLWILMLWATFANAFCISLAWLSRHPTFPILFGAIGGPVGFFAGYKMGALSLHANLWPSLIAISLAWSVAVPGLLKVRKVLERP